MKKALKIIGFIVLVIFLIIGIVFWIMKGKLERHKHAEVNANFIIENLDNGIVFNEFPEKYFPNRDELNNILGGIGKNCDWKNRDGKFVDFYTMKDIGGINSTAFIYEYYLKCDSLRFVLIYNTDKDKPELLKMNIEPIEKENSMINFPEKQLRNRK